MSGLEREVGRPGVLTLSLPWPCKPHWIDLHTGKPMSAWLPKPGIYLDIPSMPARLRASMDFAVKRALDARKLTEKHILSRHFVVASEMPGNLCWITLEVEVDVSGAGEAA